MASIQLAKHWDLEGACNYYSIGMYQKQLLPEGCFDSLREFPAFVNFTLNTTMFVLYSPLHMLPCGFTRDWVRWSK